MGHFNNYKNKTGSQQPINLTLELFLQCCTSSEKIFNIFDIKSSTEITCLSHDSRDFQIIST